MQPPSPFYPRYAAAPMLSHGPPVPASHPYPPSSSAASYVYPSQYASPYPTHPSVAYSPYVTHSPHTPYVQQGQHHPVPSVHLTSPTMLAASPALYATAAAPRPPAPSAYPAPSPETCERDAFYRKLHAFRDAIGEPIQRLPTLGFKELDLWVLYKEVVKRKGIDAVIAKKQWKEVAEALQLPSSCTDSGFRLRLHYKKYLEAFERKFYEPPEPVTPPVAQTTTARSSGKEATHGGGAKTKTVAVGSSVKKASESKGGNGEKAGWSSVTSSGSGVGSAATEAGDTENESAGSVSNGSGSRQSSGGAGGVSRAEATSKMGTSGGIVKKKKRSGGNGIVVGLKRSEGKEKSSDGKMKKGEELEEDGKSDKGVGKVLSILSNDEEGEKAEWGAGHKSSIEGKSCDLETRKDVEKEKCVSGSSSFKSRGSGEWKSGVQKSIGKRGRCGSGGVDFSVLESATLKRYARVHGVTGGAGGGSGCGGKKGLAERVAAHFSATPLRGGETATLLRFIQAVRRR